MSNSPNARPKPDGNPRAHPPTNDQQQTPKPTPGAANTSAWLASPYSFAPNTNVMDRASMPSATAEAARQRTADIMAALKSGEPGAADKLMGDFEGRSAAGGLTPLGQVWDRVAARHKRRKAEKMMAREARVGDDASVLSYGGSTLLSFDSKDGGKEEKGRGGDDASLLSCGGSTVVSYNAQDEESRKE